MPSGEYLINFDHELWIAKGTTTSAIPTSTTGLTKVFNLTDASMTSTSSTQNVNDYDSDPTSEKAAVLSISKTMPIVLNLSPGDPGYQILMEVNERGTENLAVQYFRQSAKVPGTLGTGEVRAGIATVTGFNEGRAVAGVGAITFTLTAFGGSTWYPQGQAAATVTVTTGGSGMTAATYEDVPLIPVGIGGRNITADITVAAGGLVSVAPTIVLGGQNVRVGDVYTVAAANMGGAGVMPTFTVATVA
ncbi:MAG: hypothetical protein ACO218_11560 [Steroidobacteraceae bacterium]